MKRNIGQGMAGLVVSCWLLASTAVEAGPYVNVMQPCDCPPTHYPAWHVLTPVIYRWAAWCQGPARYTFAKNLHPDVQPTFRVIRYHCPSVNPLQFSLANYPGLAGNPPSSTYQSQQTPRENPQQQLPSPREVEGRKPEELSRPNVVEPDNK